MQWDLFCRVVDNFGDVGVCWRLAADLASRGERVRLWSDDASALSWMAPRGAVGVEVRAWPLDDAVGIAASPGDVVVEAFGCELPGPFVAAMRSATPPPRWLNLEYLSAERYVERSHRLMSPQTSGAGTGLAKWFFYPGFTPRTGGLLRERDLLARQAAFDAGPWLRSHGVERREGKRLVSLFCYDAPALGALMDRLADEPTTLLLTAGSATRQVRALMGSSPQRRQLSVVALPLLTQRDYDHLLWSCDLNFVRGEDSFVRAQWAARPFVWQAYPQDDGAHRRKLDAFLERFDASPAVAALVRAWNGPEAVLPALPPSGSWRTACERWRDVLWAQADLVSQLLGFVRNPG